jgi:ubiquinone/menaquinone biosynthesis C-methylase UbiE
MGFTKFIVSQARKPTGKFGRLFARGMNFGHWPLAKWGLSHVEIMKTDIILDIGCGGGKTVNHLAGVAQEGKIYGVDYSKASIAVATSINRRYIDNGLVTIIHSSVESLPFSDDMFDLITAVETCYFWPDMVENLREIHRVLKTGGHLLIINEAYRDVNFDKKNSKWTEVGGFALHLPDEFETFLKDAGYSHVQIDALSDKNWITAIGIK